MSDPDEIDTMLEEWDTLILGLKEQIEIVRLYDQSLPESTTKQMNQATIRMHQLMQRIIKQLGEPS